ncbi:replication restart helicase PriA [Deinococcus cellulosilyticus]|uniref:ATP-dependent helicase PriA n=1 Tax=Deinococcus cellulosilyticus (strain DSM 18568 / NBRC 106333 / KACC 11606 / 5516J-15) TaxID=1223518 RepID=A0A511MYY9_DEIC1|nr:primosomal protein N' [Deinococcus cellulosilyticus]GEM45803.1 hypothetical protein DC3_14380 [Deinococcus cellulosilyticus NBRC 106333 = KACC 11606]
MSWLVALPLPIPALDFLPPHGFQGELPLGHRVVVPWQGSIKIGIVVAEGQAHTHRLREVIQVLDLWVHPTLIQTLKTYETLSGTPLGLLYCDLITCGWEPHLKHFVKPVEGADLTAFDLDLPADWSLYHNDSGVLDQVREQGLLEERFEFPIRTELAYRGRLEGEGKLTPKQKQAWKTLLSIKEVPSLAEWARQAEVSTSVVSGVLSRGWAEAFERPAGPPECVPVQERNLKKAAWEVPEKGIYRLHGGHPIERFQHLKTLIEQHLETGVLYLTPDTYRLERAWQALSHIGAQCYSGTLNALQREHIWQQVRDGHCKLVIGTYGAMGLPFPSLSLIIIEEEGSDAYKLLSGSRVFIPDLAAKLSEQRESLLLYSGSVPAVESLRFEGKVLPPSKTRVHVVNYAEDSSQPETGPLSMQHMKPALEGYPLSQDLRKVLTQVAERGRQAVLFAPRKGYSALIRCRACGYIPFCKHCDVPLKFHQGTRLMQCHQCGYRESPPSTCPKCKGAIWQPKGPGTEWILQETRQLLPGFAVYRYDKDHQDDLRPIYEGHPGIVIGTQALLQEKAPPELALVSLTLADSWLGYSDFRTDERYHKLLRQLLEWHPRRAPLLVVQTFQAFHAALLAVTEPQPADEFPLKDLSRRELLKYPPYSLLAQVEVASRDKTRSESVADEIQKHLISKGADAEEVLGPAPAPIGKVRGLFLTHLLLRAENETRLKTLLEHMDERWKARVRVEINPRNANF